MPRGGWECVLGRMYGFGLPNRPHGVITPSTRPRLNQYFLLSPPSQNSLLFARNWQPTREFVGEPFYEQVQYLYGKDMDLTDDQWQQRLTPEQYHVLRKGGTEVPGSGELLYNEAAGMYTCAACGAELFKSDAKYESKTPGLIGWPSFGEAASNNALKLQDDDTLGMHRTEVLCARCGSHLGHVFAADDSPTGQHYCINSAALGFAEQSKS
jgi:peptide-methionine (R)-S-oxide reductase